MKGARAIRKNLNALQHLVFFIICVTISMWVGRIMEGEYQGKLIALEGPDGCGKSTQLDLLSDWLRKGGHEVISTKEPTDNPIGKILKNALLGEIDLSLEAEALLFASDRAQHFHEVIRPNVEMGKIVVTGRYILSSLAYQTSRGLEQKWVEKINEKVIKPDITILIDISPEIGLERKKSSRNPDQFEKDLELQKEVRETYKRIAKEKDIPIIDGSMSRERVQGQIRREVEKVLSIPVG